MKKTILSAAALLTAAALFVSCSESSESGESGDSAITEVKTSDDFTGNIGDVTLETGDKYAVITIKDYGEITCKLFPEAAPVGVQNFIDLAESGYYDGKIIHRVIDDFMMQGGSANGDGYSVDSDPSFGVEYNAKMRHFYGALCYANASLVNGSQFYIVNSKTYSAVSKSSIESTIQDLKSTIEELRSELEAESDDTKKETYEFYMDYYSAMLTSYESQLRALEDNTDEITAKYEEVGGTPSLDGGYTVFGQTVDGFDVIDAIAKVETEAQTNSTEQSKPVTDIVIEKVEIFTK